MFLFLTEELIISDRNEQEGEDKTIGFMGDETDIMRQVDLSKCAYGHSDSNDSGSTSSDETQLDLEESTRFKRGKRHSVLVQFRLV